MRAAARAGTRSGHYGYRSQPPWPLSVSLTDLSATSWYLRVNRGCIFHTVSPPRYFQTDSNSLRIYNSSQFVVSRARSSNINSGVSFLFFARETWEIEKNGDLGKTHFLGNIWSPYSVNWWYERHITFTKPKFSLGKICVYKNMLFEV